MINYDDIDDGIMGAVKMLRSAGIETFESCQGGPGHAHHHPVIWFTGDAQEGFRAEQIATEAGYQVYHIAQFWYSRRGVRYGPYWEISFVPGAAHRGTTTAEGGGILLIKTQEHPAKEFITPGTGMTKNKSYQ